jgi:hypothetical protein
VTELEEEKGRSHATQLRKSIDESLKRLAGAVDEQQASEEMRQYLNHHRLKAGGFNCD